MFFNQMKNFYAYIDILKLFYMINILVWYFVLFFLFPVVHCNYQNQPNRKKKTVTK